MPTNLIASTPKAEMNALAFKGIMAYASFPQIRDMLLRNFGDEFVLLFAKPVENSSDGTIDWYTPVQGEAKKIIDLPEDQQKPLLETMQKMGAEIQNLAEELIQTQDPLKVTRGNILKLSLSFPSEADLYVVGGQPVFTCWGFAPGRPGVEPMSLSRLQTVASKKPVVSAPPVSVPPSKEIKEEPSPPPGPRRPLFSGCLWFLLPLLPLLLLFFLLFTSFGFLPALSGYPLFHLPWPEAIQAKDNGLAKINELETDIANLKGRLKEHASLCVPTPSIKEKTPAPQGSLVIPEDATDASFMKGRWLCQTGLSNSRTHEAVQMTFSFNEDGRGEAVVIEKDDRCTGEAAASLQNQILHIDISELHCAQDNKAYNSMSIDCENAEGSATTCYGLNKNGTKWDAVFLKLR